MREPTGYTVMIVDDNLENLRVAAGIVSRAGYEVILVRNGQDVLTGVKKHKLDAILLDVMMPGMDGFEVCQELKNNPITQNAIVIYLSAKHETADRLKGYECGGDDFIAKPFDPLELQAKVAAMCKCVEERKV